MMKNQKPSVKPGKVNKLRKYLQKKYLIVSIVSVFVLLLIGSAVVLLSNRFFNKSVVDTVKERVNSLFYTKIDTPVMALDTTDLRPQGFAQNKKEFAIRSEKPLKSDISKENIEISPKTEFDVHLEDDHKTIKISVLSANLNPGQVYNVKIKPGLIFADDTISDQPLNFVIPIEPEFGIEEINPCNECESVPSTAVIDVRFNASDIDGREFARHFRVIPDIKGKIDKDGDRFIFKPDAELPDGKYFVEVSKGLKTKSGKVLKETQITRFSVGDGDNVIGDTPYLKFADLIKNIQTNSYETLYAYRMWKSKKPMKGKIIVYKVDDKDVDDLLLQMYKYGGIKDTKNASFLKNKIKEIDVEAKPDSFMVQIHPQLSNGLYVLKAFNIENDQSVTWQILAVSDYLMSGQVNSLLQTHEFWIFDSKSLRPKEVGKVQGFRCNVDECVIATEKNVGPQGYVKLTKPFTYGVFRYKGQYILGKAVDRYATTLFDYFSPFSFNYTPYIADIELNRPVFHQGDKLEFLINIRKVTKLSLSVPQEQRFRIKICKPKGFKEVGENCIYDTFERVDKFGSITGKINLPAKRGYYAVTVYTEDNQFIDERTFDVREYELNGRSITMTVDKKYLAGNDKLVISGYVRDSVNLPLGNQKVKIVCNSYGMMLSKLNPSKKNMSRSLFVEGYNHSKTYHVSTDKSGRYSIQIDPRRDLATARLTKIYCSSSIQAGDNGFQTSVSDIFYTKGLVTALSDNQTTLYPGDDTTVAMQVLRLYSFKPVANKRVQIAVKREWTTQEEDGQVYNEETRQMETKYKTVSHSKVVLSKMGATNAQGIIKFDLKNLQWGDYRVAISYDGISEEVFLTSVYNDVYDEVDDDKNQYVYDITTGHKDLFSIDNIRKVGETVTVSWKHNIEDKKQPVLLIVNGSTPVSWNYHQVADGKMSIKLGKEHVGGTTVCVIHPMHIMKEGKLMGNSINKQCTEFPVIDPTKKLKIKASIDKTKITPGSDVNIHLNVKDAKNNGQIAAVGMTVVNEDLRDVDDSYYFWENTFYQTYYQNLRNRFTNLLVSDDREESFGHFEISSAFERGGMGAGGGGDSVGLPLRDDFNDNPYFIGGIATDRNGNANVKFKSSDAITTWFVKIWAITTDGKVANTTLTYQTFKDFYINLVNPKMLHIGDKWKAPIRLVNNTNRNISSKVAVTCKECDVDTVKNVKIDKKTDSYIYVDIPVKNLYPQLEVKAWEKGNLLDGIKYTLRSRSFEINQEYYKTKYISNDSSEFEFTLPDKTNKDLSELSLLVSPYTRLTYYEGVLEPYVLSSDRLAGALVVDNLINDKDFDRGTYVSNLLDRQKSDGGIAWNNYMSSSISDSAYTGIALTSKDWAKSSNQISRNKLISYYKTTLQGNKATRKEKLLIAWALSNVDAEEASSYVMYLSKKLKNVGLSTYEIAYLANASHNIGDDAMTYVLIKALSSKVKSTENFAYVDDRDLSNDDRIYLTSELLKLDHDNRSKVLSADVYNKMVNWLQVQQYENCMKEFNFYLANYNQIKISDFDPNKTFSLTVELNGKTIFDGKVKNGRIELPISSASLQQKNLLKFKYENIDHFFATVLGETVGNYKQKGNLDNVRITTEYVNANGSKEFHVGDTGYVKYTLTVKPGKEYLFTDYLPAGLKSTYDFYDLKLPENATMATGNFYMGDAVTAYIETEKENKAIVYTPFVVIRPGEWVGGITTLNESGNPDKLAVHKKQTLYVKEH